MHRPHHPTKEEIADLALMGRLGLEDIVLVKTEVQAEQAWHALMNCEVVGFDTESKPTFVKEEVSTGPHVVQFATLQKAYIFQLHDAATSQMASQLLIHSGIQKVGFGLAGDHVQIKRTLGIQPQNVLDLNDLFRRQGYIKELGVKSAVAVVFQQRFLKSKKASTSNWSNPTLTESQLIYAANDAWAAIKVFHALQTSRY